MISKGGHKEVPVAVAANLVPSVPLIGSARRLEDGPMICRAVAVRLAWIEVCLARARPMPTALLNQS